LASAQRPLILSADVPLDSSATKRDEADQKY
jgi:hypothetical protein